jgi:hypothetical protein
MRDETAGAPSTRERAFAVAAVRALGARAERLCGRRSPALRRLATELAADPHRLREEAKALGRAAPRNLRRVHPSWFELPPATGNPEAATWLARRAFAHLVEMSDDDQAAVRPLDKLEQMSSDALAKLLITLGRRRVATAFSGAPRAALAQLCARLGEPAASELLAEVRAIASSVSADEVKAAQRALFRRGVDVGAQAKETARALFARAGSSWIGPALASRGGDRLLRVAQRLPRDLGAALSDDAALPASETESAAALNAIAAALASPRRRSL